MPILEVLILAIVQGIGEFLPISSSGHIVVLASLFEEFGQSFDGEKLTVNIVLHLGTLLAILVIYRRRILDLLTRDRRLIGLIVVGTIPAVIVGLGLEKGFGEVLESPIVAGLMFPITGLGLLWTTRIKPGETTCSDLGYGSALLIGLAQAFAILPGISRSGSTIIAALACGMRRDEAATFSFLLAIPVIAGGGLLHLLEIADTPPTHIQPAMLLVGALVSFAVGLVSLTWLITWLQRGKLHWFAWWVLILGPAVLLWQFLR